MKPGQEPSWFGSRLPDDGPEAADQTQPPDGAPEPEPPSPSGQLPVRRSGPAGPAAPESGWPARPAIQQPPRRRIQHPLPASLPRPLTEPDQPARPADPPARTARGQARVRA